MNLLQYFYSQLNYTFLGEIIWVRYIIFCGSYLTNFPQAKLIHIWHLFLNTIESFAKARVFGNIWNFLKNRRFSKIPQKKMHKKIKKVSRISKFWSLQVQPQSKFYKIKVNNLFPNFSRRFFFILFCFSADFIFYIHRMNQPLPRFGWDFI